MRGEEGSRKRRGVSSEWLEEGRSGQQEGVSGAR